MITINDVDRRRYKEVEQEINALQYRMDELSSLSHVDKTEEILTEILELIRRRRELEVEHSELQRRLR